VLLTESKGLSALSVSDSTQAYSFRAAPVFDPAMADSGAQRLLFNQVEPRTIYRRNFNSPARPNLLSKFEFQREGGNLVVIDADGSVYQGTIQPASREEIQRRGVGLPSESAVRAVQTKLQTGDGPMPSRLGPMSDAIDAQAVENLAFRAEGTNRSLKQKVVFTGNFLNFAGNESIRGAGVAGAGSLVSTDSMGRPKAPVQGVTASATSPPTQLTLQNANTPQTASRAVNQQLQIPPNEKIEGNVAVGGTNVKIEAERVRP
jgi:hypothetical protein